MGRNDALTQKSIHCDPVYSVIIFGFSEICPFHDIKLILFGLVSLGARDYISLHWVASV